MDVERTPDFLKPERRPITGWLFSAVSALLVVAAGLAVMYLLSGLLEGSRALGSEDAKVAARAD